VIEVFFVGIFGVETKEKVIRDVQNLVCKSCGSMTSYKLIKTYSFFHFFFIPLFKWGEKYYLFSRCCNKAFEISKEIGKDLESGREIVLRDEDLQLIYRNQSYVNAQCPSCNSPLENNYSFCPHCGRKLS
jgi:hypothetical protein